MAPRNVDRDTANAVVQESLGMTADDLGMDRVGTFDDLDLGDEGDNLPGDNFEDNPEDNLGSDDLPGDRERNQEEPPARQPQKKPDDLRVTHTPAKGEFDHGKPKFDAKGNILGSDGKIIATAGREARMYQDLHKTRDKLANLTAQSNGQVAEVTGRLQKAIEIGTTVANQLAAMRDIGQLHTKAGLDDKDLRQAIDFASAYKRNPVEGLKMILTQAAANGIDLTTLGLQPGGFDTKALLDLVNNRINEAVQPIKDRNQTETAQQTRVREDQAKVDEAVTVLNTFLTANPEARDFLPVFQEIYKQPQFQHMTYGEVWARIQLNQLQMQRDGKLPNRGQQQQRNPQNRQQPRLPNGKGNPPNGNGRQNGDDLAPVSDSYEDIVRSVLTAAGG